MCQEVCPHNSPRQTGETAGTPRHEYASRTSSLDLLTLLGWKQEDRSRVLRKSAIKRATLSMLKRNAILALLNGPKAVLEEASPELAQLAGDAGEDEQIRELARGALRTFGRG